VRLRLDAQGKLDAIFNDRGASIQISS